MHKHKTRHFSPLEAIFIPGFDSGTGRVPRFGTAFHRDRHLVILDEPVQSGDVSSDGDPEHEGEGEDPSAEGATRLGPGKEHSQGEKAEDRAAKDAEDAQPSLHQARDVLHHEDQQVAENACRETTLCQQRGRHSIRESSLAPYETAKTLDIKVALASVRLLPPWNPNTLTKSSRVTAAREFKPPDTVERAPEKTPATKKPGKPLARWPEARRSMTKSGSSWSLVATSCEETGSQLE